MDCWREAEGKRVHDPYYHRFATAPQHHQTITKIVTAAATATATATVTAAAAAVAAVATTGCTLIDGPIIVGAGPSGLAVAACLHELGVPTLILERAECIASLWKHKTYDRLRLHLPKHYCELPLMPFPADLPTYPTKQQFLAYLDEYARRFQIKPVFNTAVETAEYDAKMGLWKVRTKSLKEYRSRWLIVATGENADSVVPEIQGMDEFRKSGRPVVHTSDYRSGDAYCGKKVLVVGCGNSGMEVSLDLCDYGAKPSLVVREAVHVLPREMLGRSTFGLAMWLSKWLPVRTVDRILLLASHFTIGDTANVGLRRPEMGPLELKALSGKTPVLDVGTLSRIQSGQIKVVPAIKRMLPDGAEFVDGRKEEFDAVILATGYRSNVPSWLKDNDFFSDKDGLPRKPFPNGWRGDNGLYSVGFSKKGILGATMDAKRIANDIKQHWDTAKEVELQWTAAAAQIKASLLLSAHGQTPAADKQWQA